MFTADVGTKEVVLLGKEWLEGITFKCEQEPPTVAYFRASAEDPAKGTVDTKYSYKVLLNNGTKKAISIRFEDVEE